MWQKEALYWVDLLCVSFPWIVPLKVGLRMMQQRCPAGIQIDSDTRPGVYDDGVDDVDMAGRRGNVGLDGRSMVSWRQLRDVGIRYGDRECRVVERLVDRADRAMLVLMPRIGDDVDDDDIDEGRDNGKSDTASYRGNADDVREVVTTGDTPAANRVDKTRHTIIHCNTTDVVVITIPAAIKQNYCSSIQSVFQHNVGPYRDYSIGNTLRKYSSSAAALSCTLFHSQNGI